MMEANIIAWRFNHNAIIAGFAYNISIGTDVNGVMRGEINGSMGKKHKNRGLRL